jgi:hypothetical protein
MVVVVGGDVVVVELDDVVVGATVVVVGVGPGVCEDLPAAKAATPNAARATMERAVMARDLRMPRHRRHDGRET